MELSGTHTGRLFRASLELMQSLVDHGVAKKN